MYIQSGEWVIISKIKYQFVSNRKIIGNMRFCVILCTMLAGLIPCLATLFGIVAFYESRAVELRTAEIQNQCTILSNQLSAYGYLSDPTSEVIDSNLTQLTNIYNGRVMIMDEDLCVIKDTYNLDEGKTNVSESVVRCMRTKPTNHYDKKNHYIEVTSPINIPGKKKIDGVILASVSTDSIEVTKQVFYTHGGVVVGIAAIFLAVFGVALANKLVKPIHKITGAIENVSEGYSDDVLHVDTFAETSQLSEAFNKMLGRLKQLDDSREEFVSNVSHELKTPIALIQGYAEGLCDGMCEDEESRSYYCEVIMDEANKMNKMVRQLLTLTALEFGNDTPSIAAFDVTELVHDLINSSGILIQQNAAKVSVDMPETLVVMGDEFKIEEVVTNYLTNAMNHLGGDHNIRIWSETLDGVAKIHVYNNGTPIPEEDLPNLWTKFYKVDKARTRAYGGSGIGLSIVKAIMEAHHQQYGVANHEDGVEFWFTLALAPEKPEAAECPE